MFFKKKPTAAPSKSALYEDFKRQLDAVIGEAESNVATHLVIDLLESRVMALRSKQAATYSIAPRVYPGNI